MAAELYGRLPSDLQRELDCEVFDQLKSMIGSHGDLVVLAEYISVMLQSNKPRAQIARELRTFLHDRSEEFTDWLCERIRAKRLRGPESRSVCKEMRAEDEKEELALKIRRSAAEQTLLRVTGDESRPVHKPEIKDAAELEGRKSESSPSGCPSQGRGQCALTSLRRGRGGDGGPLAVKDSTKSNADAPLTWSAQETQSWSQSFQRQAKSDPGCLDERPLASLCTARRAGSSRARGGFGEAIGSSGAAAESQSDLDSSLFGLLDLQFAPPSPASTYRGGRPVDPDGGRRLGAVGTPFNGLHHEGHEAILERRALTSRRGDFRDLDPFGFHVLGSVSRLHDIRGAERRRSDTGPSEQIRHAPQSLASPSSFSRGAPEPRGFGFGLEMLGCGARRLSPRVFGVERPWSTESRGIDPRAFDPLPRGTDTRAGVFQFTDSRSADQLSAVGRPAVGRRAIDSHGVVDQTATHPRRFEEPRAGEWQRFPGDGRGHSRDDGRPRSSRTRPRRVRKDSRVREIPRPGLTALQREALLRGVAGPIPKPLRRLLKLRKQAASTASAGASKDPGQQHLEAGEREKQQKRAVRFGSEAVASPSVPDELFGELPDAPKPAKRAARERPDGDRAAKRRPRKDPSRPVAMLKSREQADARWRFPAQPAPARSPSPTPSSVIPRPWARCEASGIYFAPA